MIRVGILGATGYTALELLKILLRHPEAEITALTSRQEGRPSIASIHPSLTQRIDVPVEDLSTKEIAARCECVFACLPHGASAAAIAPLLDAEVRVVDLSADYRLDSPRVYQEWYGSAHPDPARLGHVVYGLPELFGDQIPSARLVANPGCYPTSAILPLAPLLRRKLISPDGIIIDAKSGISGGGRTPKLNFHYPECNESLAAYAVGRHRHTPEIDQILTRAAGRDAAVIFTPHLVPMDRGILATCYATPTGDVTEEKLLDSLREFYYDHPFVRVVSHLPATKDVAHTNYCDITVRLVRGRVVAIGCIDNLIKGASGAAVQNFNLMYGCHEMTAL